MLYGIAAVFGIPSFSLTIYSATYYIAQFHASAAQAEACSASRPRRALCGGRDCPAARSSIDSGSRACLQRSDFMTRSRRRVSAGLTSTSEVVGAMALGGLGLGFASAPPNALIPTRTHLHLARARRDGRRDDVGDFRVHHGAGGHRRISRFYAEHGSGHRIAR